MPPEGLLLLSAPAPLTGTTRVAGVIGDPVGQSLSPLLHNTAFAAAGLDWVYVAFPVAAGRGADAVAAVRALGLAGLSVTMPHKEAVAGAVDRLSEVAARLGAVNTVIRDGDAVVGDNTDGAGLLDSLRAAHGWAPAGRRCVVLGTGAAARAAALALAGAGAAQVAVVGRRREAVAAAVALCGPAGLAGGVDAVEGADLVVNATPVGMAGVGPAGAGLPLGLNGRRLGAGQVVVDLVYRPAVTPLVAEARARGATAEGGLGMLVHQAGHQFRAWTGLDPPLGEMWAAAEGHIARSG